jgi:hypothetical protein
MSEMENSKAKNSGLQVSKIEKKKEVEKIKKVLDNMLDFLAEMPIDKYHDYREFRNLRLRQYLIHSFMREKYARKVTRRKNS